MAVRPRPALDTSPAGPRKEDEEQEKTVEAPTKKRTAKNKARTAPSKSEE
jgi:hypothetical protein